MIHDVLLSAKRLTGDLEADAFINNVFDDPEKKQLLQSWLGGFHKNNQIKDVPVSYVDYLFLQKAGELPVWANSGQMKTAVKFFADHAEAIMSLLGLLSLPYCYAAAKGAMVLYLSDRMRNDAAKRLYDTADFVWDVLSPDAFSADGSGFAAILKVRLMHAAARYYTLKSGKWDIALGVPVNQEDMAGTNLSFSLIVIRGLRKFGYSVSYDDQQAYIHLWNVIGYLLGLDEVLLPGNGKEAFILEQMIRGRQFEPSEQGRALTNSLSGYFSSVNDGSIFSNTGISQVMRYLMGDEVADILGLSKEKLSSEKIQLLRLRNFLQSFNLPVNSRLAYRLGHSKFKQRQPQ